MNWPWSSKRNQEFLISDVSNLIMDQQSMDSPRNTWVRSTLPTGSIWYLEGLSLRLRKRSLAVRREHGWDASDSGASAKGSFEPLLRFRPVRLGTVTLRRTLFDWMLVDWTDRAMASSGRNTRLASMPSAGFRICIISAFIQHHLK